MKEYEIVIEELEKSFSKGLTSDQESLLLVPFKNLLTMTLNQLLEPSTTGYVLPAESVNKLLIELRNEIIDLSYDDRVSYLFPDMNFELLLELSNKVYNKALLKWNDNAMASKEECILYEKQLDKLLSKVEKGNIESAKRLYSETKLEINYLKGETELVSLRLGREIRAAKGK